MKFIGNLLVIVIILTASIYIGRNIIIKSAINSGGSAIIGSNINVDSVNFSPLDGVFNIQGLSVANPNGFDAGNALYLGEVNIKMDPKSLLSQAVKIEEIRISKPEINIVGKPGSTNLSRLKKNLSSSAKAKAKKSAGKTAGTKTHSKNKTVEIRYFILEKGKVSASFDGLGKTANIKLPTIEIHNIGKGRNLNVNQVVAIVLTEVIKLSQKTALSGAGFGGQIENIKSDLQEKAKDLRNKLKEKLKGFRF